MLKSVQHLHLKVKHFLVESGIPATYHYALVNSEKDISVVSAAQIDSGQKTATVKHLLSNNIDFRVLLKRDHK